MIPLNEITYNCGADIYYTSKLGTYPNAHTISVEMCIDENGNFTDHTLNSAYALGKYLEDKYKVEHFRHYDVTKKMCPKPLIGSDDWEKFVHKINTCNERVVFLS